MTYVRKVLGGEYFCWVGGDDLVGVFMPMRVSESSFRTRQRMCNSLADAKETRGKGGCAGGRVTVIN